MGPRDLLLRAAATLDRLGIDYFVTGSMASMLYGEMRTTLDIDVVVGRRWGHVQDVVDAFPEPEFCVSKPAVLQAMEHCSMFNVLHVASALKIDFMVPETSPFNESRSRRRRAFEVEPGVRVMVSAPEDVILKKLEVYRLGGSDKHLRDIASMIRVFGETFDKDYLDHWAERLGVAEEWRAVRERLAR
jgi:hypothetical protein